MVPSTSTIVSPPHQRASSSIRVSKNVRFEDLKYDLTEFFSKKPVFDAPPLRFKKYTDGEEGSNKNWLELYDILLGETKNQTYSYIKRFNESK